MHAWFAFFRLFFFATTSLLLLTYLFSKGFFFFSPKKTLSRPIRWIYRGIVGSLFFVLLGGWQMLYFVHPEWLRDPLFEVLIWTGALFFGWLIFVTLAYLSLDVFKLGKILLSRLSEGRLIKKQAPPSERRGFLIQTAVLGSSTILTGIGGWVARKGLKVKAVSIPIEGLPEALSALKVVQITDLHVGLTIRKDYVEQVVEQALAAQPDLIVLTGDLIDGDPGTLEADLEPLRQLSTGAPLGAFFVLGNHEYYWGVQRWIQKLTSLGLTLLLNEHRLLSFRGETFLLAGVPDFHGTRFVADHFCRPSLALQHPCPPPKPLPLQILLSHRPNVYEEAAQAGFHLMLSGHTHGGQFFPISLLIGAFYRYARGLNRHRNLWVYVNTGTGYWAAPQRLAVPPEITLFSFTASRTPESPPVA